MLFCLCPAFQNAANPGTAKHFTDLYIKLKEDGVYEREALDPELPRKYSEEEIDFITI